MSENEEFIREFLDECEENLDQLDQDLVALEQDPHDAKRLESIFRTIHTIKGTSGFFAFSKLGALAHDGESLLGRLRDGELTLNQEIATTLLQLIDAIREMLANIRDSGGEGPGTYEKLSASLIRLALSAGDQGAAQQVLAASDAAADPEVETEEQQDSDTIAEQISDVGSNDVPDDAPTSELTTAQPGTTGDVLSQPADTSPIDTPLDDLTEQNIDQVSLPMLQLDPDSVTLQASPIPDPPIETDRPDTAASVPEGSIRVDVRLLDRLMDMAGELVLARNQLNQFSAALDDVALVKTIQRLGSITSELQQGVMQTRMQPMSTIWGKFPRVVRDLALACGKEIALDQKGADTELDRSLLEAIKDPLTHLLRNAVDHGIESPEDRELQGKSRQGRVLLRAYHEGGQVNIEIIDDGGGIDADRVKQRALSRGLIDAQQASSITGHELVQMIFLPGFSTAESVTDVSGRGVGMDVVKTNIERIGGTVGLENRPGMGTTVRITIPLTLAIVPALIVTVGDQRFAIAQVNLVELLNCGDDASGKQIEWIDDAPVYRLRGNLLPLVYLSQILQLDHEDEGRKATKIVVLQAEGRRFGLVVDKVINTQEIVVKPLGRALRSVALFAGATIMGDGTVVLILDAVGVARTAGLKVTGPDLARAADEPGQQAAASQPFLLCENSEHCRVAIRLSDVHRLEEFPVAKVQRAASMEAAEYNGQIMPLARLSKLLGWSDEDTRDTRSLSVVVHRESGHMAGLVVPRIVDIVQCSHEIEQRSGENGAVVGWTLIQGHVIDVIDLRLALRLAGVHFAEHVGDAT